MKLTTDSNSVHDIIQRYENRPSVRQALIELFGDVPIDKNIVDLSNISSNDLKRMFENAGLPILIQVRNGGNYSRKSFYLSRDHNWNIVIDNEGYSVLVCSG